MDKVIYAGNAIYEHAGQPPTGLVLGIPQVPVQYGPSIYVQQRCGNAPN